MVIIESPFDSTITKSSFNLLYEAILDGHLRVIYKNLLQNDVPSTTKNILNIIDAIEDDTFKVSNDVTNYCLPLLYTILIDISMGKTRIAHDKIRDIHYFIASRYKS